MPGVNQFIREVVMFILGIMALSQSMVLPGALILKVINFRGSFIQRLGYIIGLSLIVTFLGILFLTLLGLYKQIVVIILFVVQVVGLLWMYRYSLGESITTLLPQIWNHFVHSLNDFFPPLNEDETSTLAAFVRSIFKLGFFILAISVLWWAFKLFFNYLGSIFTAWDAINSWNKWALTWANGHVPLYTQSYPQLIPAHWSLTYIFIGSSKVQFFAKALMLCFTFLILLLFMDLGIQTSKGGFLAGCVITYLLLKKFLLPQLTNGYVDIAVAFFASLTIYSLVKLLNTPDENQRPVLLVLSAVFAGGAAMVKQTGVYVFLVYFPLVYLGILRPLYNGRVQPLLRPVLHASTIATFLALPWYIFKFFIFRMGLDRPEVQNLMQVSTNQYDAVAPTTQFLAALGQFDKYIWLFPLILLGMFLLPSFYRWLTLLYILPFPLIWSFLASYDTRNLSICLPILGMVAGLVIEEVLLRFVSWVDNLQVVRLRVFLIPIILLGALLFVNTYFPSAKLMEEQSRLQRQAFSPQKNDAIYEIVAKEGPGARILTNYPIDYLPGLEDVKVDFGYRDYNDFLYRLQDPAIEYLLLPRVIDSRISEYIDEKLTSGDYELIFENKEWLYYRMIHIVRR
jgi:hypothetical protein